MELSNLDITLSRIRQIETKIKGLDQKFGAIAGINENDAQPFKKILNEKIQENEQGKGKDKDINTLVEKFAKENNLDKKLVDAVIKTESNYNANAVSPAGAQGLMQLMPLTAQSLGVVDPFDPEQNISGGTKYLKNMIDKYNSVELGLAAYNAGPESVNRYGGIPPYQETQNYVKKILELQKNH